MFRSAYAAAQENSKFSGLRAPATNFILDQEVAGIWRPLRVSGSLQHPSQVALQRDLQPLAVGLEHDRLDECSNGFRRSRAARLALQRQTEATNLSPDRRRTCAGAAVPASLALRDVIAVRLSWLRAIELVLDRQRRDAVLDRLNELPDFAFDGCELLAAVR
jgi:hypothetical protein